MHKLLDRQKFGGACIIANATGNFDKIFITSRIHLVARKLLEPTVNHGELITNKVKQLVFGTLL